MKKLVLLLFILTFVFSFCSCEDLDDTEPNPMLIIKFKFDPTQERLNNLGQQSVIPVGNLAQSPLFNSISSHYIELAPNANTQLGQGQILYHAPETTLGGDNAIDFSQSKIVSEGETFIAIPLKDVLAGTYEWTRVSLSYQNFEITVRHQGVDYQGTLASFVGFNTYIETHSIGNSFFEVNGNRPQGYWAFALNDNPFISSGQAPAGATTVPNPLAATSPIPAGSCVVTGKFSQPLVITGQEKSDITITLSLSTNNSFEWQENSNNTKFDPSLGDNVVDMGLRGLIPSYKK
jgi:hypothetical protein